MVAFLSSPMTTAYRIKCLRSFYTVHAVVLYDLIPTDVWSAQPTSGESPPPLAYHSFIKIDHHRAVVFGGWSESGRLNDTYVLDMEKWVWEYVIHSNLYIIMHAFWNHVSYAFRNKIMPA